MTDNQVLLIVGAGLFAAFTIYKKISMGRNKVKLKEMLNSKAKVVDVRSPGEFNSGHFKGAINIPVSDLPGRLKELGSKDQAIIVYCASGGRSGLAKNILVSAGFSNVENGVNLDNLQSLA